MIRGKKKDLYRFLIQSFLRYKTNLDMFDHFDPLTGGSGLQ